MSCKGGKFRTEVVQEPGQAHVFNCKPSGWQRVRGLVATPSILLLVMNEYVADVTGNPDRPT